MTIEQGAFEYCYSLSSAELPNSVTFIGLGAFRDCGFTSFTIPASVADIGRIAFYNNTKLTEINVDEKNSSFASVDGVLFSKSITTLVDYPDAKGGNYVIPDSVTEIGDSAFECSSAITSVTIPSGVSEIEAGPFSDCPMLAEINVDSKNADYASVDGVLFNKSVTELIDYPAAKSGDYTVPDTVTEICQHSAADSVLMTSLTIPDSVTSIGNWAFDGCTSLTEVTLGNSVTEIGTSAFMNCTSLTSIVIPDSVTFIDYTAFYRCTSLTSITIPESVTEIGDRVFEDCENVTIYGVVGSYANTYADENGIPFADIDTGIVVPRPSNPSDDFEYNILQDGAEIYDYTGMATELVIPAEIDGYAVTSIGSWTFSGRRELTSVTIPDSITSIGEYAFYNCEGLTSVDISANVTEIGVHAFSGCIKMTTINVSEDNPNYTSVDGILFNKSLTSLIQYPGGKTDAEYTVPDSVQAIAEGGFRGNRNLTSVTFSENVRDIGNNIFENCNGLVSISVDENNENFTSVDGVLFNKDITEILRFPRSKEGASYTVPDTVTVIGTFAFQSSDLTEIVLHDGITELKNGALLACFDLKSITLPSSLEKIGIQALSYCQGLSSITKPDGVTEIDTRAFSDSTGLKYVVIPESVTTIDDDILRNCGDVIIYGVVGSYAQTYAEENGITFADIDGGIVEPGTLTPGAPNSGDLDGDNVITIVDIAAVAKIMHNQIALTAEIFAAADVNDDGVLNVVDLAIVKYLLLNN
jgi:hypothetical protein